MKKIRIFASKDNKKIPLQAITAEGISANPDGTATIEGVSASGILTLEKYSGFYRLVLANDVPIKNWTVADKEYSDRTVHVAARVSPSEQDALAVIAEKSDKTVSAVLYDAIQAYIKSKEASI